MHETFQHTLRTLSEQLQADECLKPYILIDPLLREPLDPALLEVERCQVLSVPLRFPGLRVDQYPRLIRWRPQAVATMTESLRLAYEEQSIADLEATQGLAIGGWLLSTADEDSLAAHLANIMWLHRPGSGRRYVRWADRRVLEWLWPCISESQRSQLMGPIHSWWTLGRQSALIKYTAPQPEAHRQTESLLTLDRRQWLYADRGELVHELIRGWARFEPSLPADYLMRAGDAVLKAQERGLSSAKDIVLLGAYTLQIHPNLCEHSRVINLVQRSLEQGLELSETLEAISDQDWEEIKAQLDTDLLDSRLFPQQSQYIRT